MSSPFSRTIFRTLELTTITERHDYKMDHLRYTLWHIHALVRRRLHSRQTTIKEGLTTSLIPPRKSIRPLSSLSLSFSFMLIQLQQFLISYSERKRHGQVPQNHFTFYAQEQPYYPHGQPYQQRPGAGPYAEPPPMYNGQDAPPQYFAPPGASKMNPSQGGVAQPGMEMPQYGTPPAPQYASGPQESGVVRNDMGDVEQGQSQQLPPRPQQAKEKLKGIVGRFRR
jgi:hypothetical protein